MCLVYLKGFNALKLKVFRTLDLLMYIKLCYVSVSDIFGEREEKNVFDCALIASNLQPFNLY